MNFRFDTLMGCVCLLVVVIEISLKNLSLTWIETKNNLPKYVEVVEIANKSVKEVEPMVLLDVETYFLL